MHLFIQDEPEYPNGFDPYESAINELSKITTCASPIRKCRCVV